MPCVLAASLLLATPPAFAEEPPADSTATQAEADEPRHPVLLYLPNRIFDLTDMVRARVRAGPGVQVGVRATRPLSANLGAYGALWVGLHGPRGGREVPLPVGFEAFSGAQASVAKIGTDMPYYGPTEVGADFQAALVGVALGVAPLEIVDFVLGFFFIDIRHDDL